MKYLVRVGSGGYAEKEGEPKDPSGQPLRPWAVTPTDHVVYSDWQTTTSGLEALMQIRMTGWDKKTTLRSYDKMMSQKRRRDFETLLASDAKAHPDCVLPAVNLVTKGMKDYVGSNKKDMEEAGGVIKLRCFSDTASARLGSLEQGAKLQDKEAWELALKTCEGSDVARILGIQTSIANVLSRTKKFNDTQSRLYKDTAAKVAPKSGYLHSWFNDDTARGRQASSGGSPTSVPGILNPGAVTQGEGEKRIRGIDQWKQVEGSTFVKGVDMRNLVFGAGRSGTTGELLKAFRVFAGVDDREHFKQYLLAIVIYLVGGGHHTCHEIFSVANLLLASNGPQSVSTLSREAYVPGRYLPYLPDSYTRTPGFEALKNKYYDICAMGHLHAIYV